MAKKTAQARRRRVLPEKLSFFRYGLIGDRIVVTNDAAEWHLLSEADFELFLAGNQPRQESETACFSGSVQDGESGDTDSGSVIDLFE